MNTKIIVTLSLVTLILAACSLQISPAGQATVEPSATVIITATLPATQTPRATMTPVPASPTATVPPMTGTTTTKVNVRRDPNTTGETLGVLDEYVNVDVTGKDQTESWLRIAYDKGQDGYGWVAARFIRLNGQISKVPVVGEVGNANGPILGSVSEHVYVRAGPSTTFDTIDLLNVGDIVTLTGKNKDSTWLQIKFPKGPEGKGWVTAEFIKSTGINSLPIVTAEGSVIGTATPTGIPATPTATLTAAAEDNDSEQSPSAMVTLSESGNHSFQYTGEVSAPEGDPEDWFQLTAQSANATETIYVSLACAGNGKLQVNLVTGNGQEDSVLACGDTSTTFDIEANTPYLLQLIALAQGSDLSYVSYTLKVSLEP